MGHLHIVIFLNVLLVLIFTPLSSPEPHTWFGSAKESLKRAYQSVACRIHECCDKLWLPKNFTGLMMTLSERLYGQHLVMQSIVPLIEGHYAKNSPNKALVLSFHGMPGVGKNYVASMIAEHLYEGGMTSKFVRLFIGGVHFPIPEEFENYKQQIKTWIVERVTACELSLFIIDELDMMDGRVLEAIKPFIDYHQHIDGVNFRRSIFIFLSNMASYEITNKTFEHFRLGKPRDTISLSEMNEIIKQTSYANEGGLQFSKLIKHQLIDHFIPFLPLEREHTMQCIRWHFKLKNYEMTEERVKVIADSIMFSTDFSSLYAVSGCKEVETVIDRFMGEQKGKKHKKTEL